MAEATVAQVAEPQVVQAVRAQRAALLAREAAQMKEMAQVWGRAEAQLQSAFDALALQIQGMRDAGEAVNPGKVYRLERYSRLLFQVRQEMEGYADYAAKTVTAGQESAVWLAQQEAQHTVRIAVEQTRAGAIVPPQGVGAGFVQLNPRAVEAMVGIMGDGTPLRTYLQGVYGDAAEGMTQYLTRAVTQGLNPRQTAREMAKGLRLGLDRALIIARTEQLRVYRESSRLTYEASGVVAGYRRISAKSTRTCLGCLIEDGRVYPVSVPFEDHPNGRCAAVPILASGPTPQWETGADWLARQSEADQVKIMGPTRQELWATGQVPLKQMAMHTYDPLWGGAWVPTPVKNLFVEDVAAAVA